MQVKNLKPADYNPRKITDPQLARLKKSLEEFGDLSGVVFNKRTQQLVSGHQRCKNFSPDWKIEKSAHKDKTGTVALGYIETPSGRMTYREVDWPEDKEKKANIAANKQGGEFDDDLLKSLLDDLKLEDPLDLELIGFNNKEINNLQIKPEPKDAEPQIGRAADKLDNIIDAVDYLHAQGWKIKKSTAYNHRNKGWLRPESDGKFLKSALDKYAAMKLKRLDARLDDKTEKMSADKQAAETRRINAQAEREELKLRRERGLYIPKESMERELSYRAMVFKMDGDSFCRSEAGAIIELVSGDKDKIPDLQEFLLERFHKWLARYAADKEFTVPQPAAAEMISDTDDENSELVDGE